MYRMLYESRQARPQGGNNLQTITETKVGEPGPRMTMEMSTTHHAAPFGSMNSYRGSVAGFRDALEANNSFLAGIALGFREESRRG